MWWMCAQRPGFVPKKIRTSACQDPSAVSEPLPCPEGNADPRCTELPSGSLWLSLLVLGGVTGLRRMPQLPAFTCREHEHRQPQTCYSGPVPSKMKGGIVIPDDWNGFNLTDFSTVWAFINAHQFSFKTQLINKWPLMLLILAWSC